MSRWLPLYLRSRRVPLAVATSVGAVIVVGGAWRFFAGRPEVPAGLAAMTTMLALAPLISTLSGDEDALESTAAMPWPPRRAVHLAGLFAVLVALIVGAASLGVDFGTTGQILRNCAGLVGLAGLGAAFTGAQLAWLAPVSWTGIQVVEFPPVSGSFSNMID
ncbi:hypothetical protein JIG36_50815 [Actinoplanes sp. LDG1-06]|uniref:Uncharacterized protein n=1 Tax=Paractinoplanes ovalisporus TaxID=2810368 RepID=A0ABS2AX55_9ACTN|nr:hypothetical protein [Actinoplanes ovalisporus]MBM2623811.1 hypothetical protein [Actinoplanes ovalisporus]